MGSCLALASSTRIVCGFAPYDSQDVQFVKSVLRHLEHMVLNTFGFLRLKLDSILNSVIVDVP